MQESLLELSFLEIEHVAQTVLTDRNRDGVVSSALTRVMRNPVRY
jgi:hypothetical protein